MNSAIPGHTEVTPEWVDAQGLAAWLHLEESTIRRYVADGVLPEPHWRPSSKCSRWHIPSMREHLGVAR